MTKRVHSAFDQPDRSWLPKMSAKTMISNHTQMNSTLNQTNDQRTVPRRSRRSRRPLSCEVPSETVGPARSWEPELWSPVCEHWSALTATGS
jgi:hypothetical protein